MPPLSPLVSIIVPCFNAAAWLEETLESALAQTWPHREIIVIDDRSRDESLAIAQRYAVRGVRVVSQPNAGASAARNHGLRLARGDYVQFLDADDLLAPEKISRQILRLANLSENHLASGSWVRFDTDAASAVLRPFANSRDLSGVEFLQINYEAGVMMHPAAWLTPRALLDRAGPWDERLTLNDDGEYFARVVLASSGIAYCSEAHSYYRSNLPDSLSKRQDARSLESLFLSVDLTLQHLLNADRSPRTRAAAAYAWKWTAYELYPGAPVLAQRAEENSRRLGGSTRPFPGSGRFQLCSRLLGWRLAKRLCG